MLDLTGSQHKIISSIVSAELQVRYKLEFDKIIEFGSYYIPYANKIKQYIESNRSISENIADDMSSFNENMDSYLPQLEVNLGDENDFLDSLLYLFNETQILNVDSTLIRSMGYSPGELTDLSGIIETPDMFIKMNSSSIANGSLLHTITDYSSFEFRISALISALSHDISFSGISTSFNNITKIYDILVEHYSDYIDQDALYEKLDRLTEISDALFLNSKYLYDIDIMFDSFIDIPLSNEYINNIKSLTMSYDIFLNNISGQIINRTPGSGEEGYLIELDILNESLAFE